MQKFTLRDVDPLVWANASARATSESWKLPELIKQLLADYAAGLVTPSRVSPEVDAARARVDGAIQDIGRK